MQVRGIIPIKRGQAEMNLTNLSSQNPSDRFRGEEHIGEVISEGPLPEFDLASS